jgi:3-hydroxyisobutyrate dehydrogenase-like beta-hydroxyacid dehydrogenase
MITLPGTGLLGSGFARALCAKSESVRVWNRTPAKALALAEVGATPVSDPAEADGAGLALTLLPAVAALMDRHLAQGLGHADWTVIARDVVGDRAAAP